MKILSLYDGMACGMIAMINSGVDVEKYDAYEIDKYAIQTAKHNFPMIEEHGDIFNADFEQYKGYDFVLGGSPCTYWSIAKRGGRETVASGMGWDLFQQYVRAIDTVKPKYFIYENNKSMSKEIRRCIDETFGFEAVMINSALVSAQNRYRLYWVGKLGSDGIYRKVRVKQPKDLGILLKDIIDGNGEDLCSKDKSYVLTASYDGAVAWNTIERSQRTMVAEPLNITEDGKSQTLKAQYYKSSMANFLNDYSKGELYGATGVVEKIEKLKYQIEFDEKGKPIKAIDKDKKSFSIYEVKNGTIKIREKEYSIKLADGYYIIRKLNVKECMRLQTVPDTYEFPVSDCRAIKMLGNGWTCSIISHLINTCLEK